MLSSALPSYKKGQKIIVGYGFSAHTAPFPNRRLSFRNFRTYVHVCPGCAVAVIGRVPCLLQIYESFRYILQFGRQNS